MTGNQLRHLRLEKKWTQQELADKVYVTHHAISQYESGKRQISSDIEVKLGEVFGLLPFHIKITDEFATNVLDSAFMWCDYWACDLNVTKEPTTRYTEDLERLTLSEFPKFGGELVLTDYHEDKQYAITLDIIKRGISRYLSKRPHRIFTDHQGELDSCYYDAILCDAMLQEALMNDVVYG